jgi:hypothetical protein
MLATVNQTAGPDPEPAVFVMSEVFPNRTICLFCGLPVLPLNCDRPGRCTMCAEKIDRAKANQQLSVLSQVQEGKVGRRSTFTESLSELKRDGSPATTRVTEALLHALGGAEELGKMIASDIRSIRGDDLDEDMKKIFVRDNRVLTRLYEIAGRMIAARDELVKGVGDPMEGMSTEDLLALTAEAAEFRVQCDPEFRMQLLRTIKASNPEDFDTLYLEEIGVLQPPSKTASSVVVMGEPE